MAVKGAAVGCDGLRCAAFRLGVDHAVVWSSEECRGRLQGAGRRAQGAGLDRKRLIQCYIVKRQRQRGYIRGEEDKRYARAVCGRRGRLATAGRGPAASSCRDPAVFPPLSRRRRCLFLLWSGLR